ncbi:TPA: integrase [Pseudomonas aeruginosa]
MTTELPAELDFLKSFYTDPRIEYKKASWLVSEFDSPIWKYDFNFATPNTINWNIILDDETSLLANKNKPLLEGLKYFLTTSTRSVRGSTIELGSLATQMTMFNRAIHVGDYILLNAKEYQLSRFGLAGINSHHMKKMLDVFSSANGSEESVYDWTKTISNFCLNLVHTSNPIELDSILDQHPRMRIVTDEQQDEHQLELPIDLIPHARAALYLHGYYKKRSIVGVRAPNTLNLAKSLYANTLKGGHLKLKTLSSLEFSTDNERETISREHPASSVRTGDHEAMTSGPFRAYRFLTYNLGILHEIGLPAPEVSHLKQILDYEPSLSEPARFRTLPYPIVRETFRKSIEYHFKYGELLVEGFCRMAEHCTLNGIAPTQLTNEELQDIMPPALIDMGIRKLGLACQTVSTRHGTPRKQPSYFIELRNNVGLIECLRIYIGCIQMVVGTIMARRIGEMLDLHSTDCLDKSERWLIFLNRKSTSNLFGIRQRQARPIEPVAVKMIKNLISMQQRLLKCGFTTEMTNLFASPGFHGDTGLTQTTMYAFNRNLDLLCDRFELPLNSKGERYYIRQHQLRRFFSMVFFHSSSFGGLETLQWMLGHTDMRHVWNYITESTDGAVLRSAKAQFIAESLHDGDITAYEDLAELLKNRYNTDNFALVDTAELEDAIADLMRTGKVQIEPEFFTDESGQLMRVVVKVQGIN